MQQQHGKINLKAEGSEVVVHVVPLTAISPPPPDRHTML